MNKLKNELKQLSMQELASKVDELRRELFSLRLQDINTSLKDKTQFKKLRRGIACALTYMQQKVNKS
ncbi:50S ribosomal protein L29 [Candidatus Babela massiliensis]|uniref:Large ribosomal subunit protein uL29 n=1 Tax=Candidatus Babela massiliensis TaxID=673862 RepID=V6DG22_9BACT|nr:50S ribosomal protein L29 [Candidatus Babela massiliensis]CDK30505.1 Ribosomal protein L29 [Candidatus Babela massiliensis]